MAGTCRIEVPDETRRLFFDESLDSLDRMESGLLRLDALGDREAIHAVFRAAHSIKGAAATLGFAAIARLTHEVETLLAAMRSGHSPVSSQSVELLLKALDCLRAMLRSAHDGTPFEASEVERLEGALRRALVVGAAVGSATPREDSFTGTSGGGPTFAANAPRWVIDFRPNVNLFRDRREPARVFEQLSIDACESEVSVEADVSDVPALGEFDPEDCRLAFKVRLHGQIPAEKLRSAFESLGEGHHLECAFLPGAEDARLRLGECALGSESAAGRPPDRTSAASIRVATSKVDRLVDLADDFAQVHVMLKDGRTGNFEQALARLASHVRELQESVIRIRMLPLAVLVSRLPRMVHDLSLQLGKKVELHLAGEAIEIDRTVLEKISDPLMHMVRNALDHGIETPERRRAAGKPEVGRLELAAVHADGCIVIEVRDDGAGLDLEKIRSRAHERGLIAADRQPTRNDLQELIFVPGLTTVDCVSALSGRGVGMDVVRRNVEDLGGHVQVESSAGAGSTFRIRLPLTLAILDGRLVRFPGRGAEDRS